jgi:2'-5' RNA ligase
MMGTTRQYLYCITIIPPEPVYSEAREFQQHIAEIYHSKEALKVLPHITLIPPFHLEESREAELFTFLGKAVSGDNPFELSIDGFGSFTVGVIYAAVIAGDKLKKLEKELTLSFYKKFNLSKERGPAHAFIPHITMAYKDLTPFESPRAWSEFKDKLYRRKWMLKDIAVLRHNGKSWEVIKKVELGTAKDMMLELGL